MSHYLLVFVFACQFLRVLLQYASLKIEHKIGQIHNSIFNSVCVSYLLLSTQRIFSFMAVRLLANISRWCVHVCQSPIPVCVSSFCPSVSGSLSLRPSFLISRSFPSPSSPASPFWATALKEGKLCFYTWAKLLVFSSIPFIGYKTRPNSKLEAQIQVFKL